VVGAEFWGVIHCWEVGGRDERGDEGNLIWKIKPSTQKRILQLHLHPPKSAYQPSNQYTPSSLIAVYFSSVVIYSLERMKRKSFSSSSSPLLLSSISLPITNSSLSSSSLPDPHYLLLRVQDETQAVLKVWLVGGRVGNMEVPSSELEDQAGLNQGIMLENGQRIINQKAQENEEDDENGSVDEEVDDGFDMAFQQFTNPSPPVSHFSFNPHSSFTISSKTQNITLISGNN